MATTKRKALVSQVLASSRAALVSVAIFSLAINLLMLTGPLFMLQIYDRVLTSGHMGTLLNLLILVIGLYGFLGLLEYVRQRIMMRIGLRFDERIGAAGFTSFVTMPLRHGPRAEVMQPISDIDRIRQFFSGQGVTALFDMPFMPVFLLAVFALHTLLGLVGTVGAVILFFIALWADFATKGALGDADKQVNRRRSFAEAARRNAEVLKGMAMTRNVLAVWEKTNRAYIRAQAKAGDLAGSFSVTTKVFRLFLQSLVLATGAWLAIQNLISPGAMIAASILTARALQPVELALGHWRAFVAARQSYRRLKAMLEEPEREQETELPAPVRELRVEDLYIAPPGSKTMTVRGVKFGLAAGAGLGIIGRTGCGKSTLLRAITGIWPAARGSVRLDGAPLDQYPAHQIARHIGYLPQDVELFDGTIAENIARFDPERTSEKVVEAARQAGVHELILRFENGYDMELGEAAYTLSAGQRQRIGLARALYGDPFLVALDEPNSNLDADGDMALAAAVNRIRARGGIVIVVAHRPGAVAAIDHLLYMEDGAPKMLGPKPEVLAKLDELRRGDAGKPGRDNSGQGNSGQAAAGEAATAEPNRAAPKAVQPVRARMGGVTATRMGADEQGRDGPVSGEEKADD